MALDRKNEVEKHFLEDESFEDQKPNENQSSEIIKVENEIFRQNDYNVSKVKKINVHIKNCMIKKYLFIHQRRVNIEYDLMYRLIHPNVIRMLGINRGLGKENPSILYEYCEMNLHQFFIKHEQEMRIFDQKDDPQSDNKKKKYELDLDKQLIFFIYQIAEGMNFIHSKDIVLCGLNPINIMISENNRIKICSCLNSCMKQDEDHEIIEDDDDEFINYFLAPDIQNDHFDEKVDVYSFGLLVLYILNKGKIPYTEENPINIPKRFTQFSKDLIRECINSSSTKRPDFNTICKKIKKNIANMLNISDENKKNVVITNVENEIRTLNEDIQSLIP